VKILDLRKRSGFSVFKVMYFSASFMDQNQKSALQVDLICNFCDTFRSSPDENL